MDLLYGEMNLFETEVHAVYLKFLFEIFRQIHVLNFISIQ